MQEFYKLYDNMKDKKKSISLKLTLNWYKFAIDVNIKAFKKLKSYEGIAGLSIFLKKVEKETLKYDKDFETKKEEFIETIKARVNEVREKALISCFSKRYDSILMWSHYGKDHTGVCIEYDRPKEDFKDVNYSKRRKLFDIIDTTRRILGYMLNGKKVDIKDKKIIDKVMMPFLTKADDWKYEKEIKCILNANNEMYILMYVRMALRDCSLKC